MSIAHTATVSVYMVRALKTYPLSSFQVSNMILCSLSSVMPNSLTLWTVAHHAPLSMGFPRQEYWSGLPFPPLRDLPDPRIEPTSFAL